jgi:ribosomal protein S18 acetylase RimI-like enzyme
VSTEDRGFVIRLVRAEEFNEIKKLIDAVVYEKYGHLFAGSRPPPYNRTSWTNGWVVTSDGAIAGVGFHESGWITDIWMKSEFRNLGIGTKLLNELERNVARDGHPKASLRCVGENEAALRFYERNDWREVKRYPHEKWGVEMVDMAKEFVP